MFWAFYITFIRFRFYLIINTQDSSPWTSDSSRQTLPSQVHSHRKALEPLRSTGCKLPNSSPQVSDSSKQTQPSSRQFWLPIVNLYGGLIMNPHDVSDSSLRCSIHRLTSDYKFQF